MNAQRIGFGFGLVAVLLAVGLLSCDSTGPDTHRDFVVDVNGERFVMRATDSATIRQAVDVINGRENMFPIGPLRRGNGGFNTPWSWHMDPDEVRLTEIAIEACDGLPSFVEKNLDTFLRPEVGYCPWSARIVGEK